MLPIVQHPIEQVRDADNTNSYPLLEGKSKTYTLQNIKSALLIYTSETIVF